MPSGIAAVMLATIPAFMALSEIIILANAAAHRTLGVALLVGIAGVAVLMSRSLNRRRRADRQTGRRRADLCFHQLVGGIDSHAQAAAAGIQSDELGRADACRRNTSHSRRPLRSENFTIFIRRHVTRGAWLRAGLLIVAGSIVGFTAYVWLIHHESPTKVGTYAYVNPIVAVLVGYFFGGEALSSRTILGTLCVLISVIVITTTRAKKAEPTLVVESAPESVGS